MKMIKWQNQQKLIEYLLRKKMEKKIEKIEETVSEEPERKEEKIISLKTNYRDSDE